MATDHTGDMTDETLAAERDEASAKHVADRPPTQDEERAIEDESLDPGVAEHYQEMAERGVEQQGEGRIQ